mgnify:CR=1 FL=1
MSGKILDTAVPELNYRRNIIGDSLTSDIQGGLNAEIRTIWFNPNHSKADKIIPDYEFDSLPKLPQLLSEI